MMVREMMRMRMRMFVDSSRFHALLIAFPRGLGAKTSQVVATMLVILVAHSRSGVDSLEVLGTSRSDSRMPMSQREDAPVELRQRAKHQRAS